MSKEFKKGDRVKLLQNVDYAKKGMIGTCMVDYSEDEFGYKFIPVEFDDKFEGGHGCAGLTNPDRGHYIDPNVLKKIEPSHAFTLVITSKGDHTDAKLIHGKHTDKWVWVDRYKEDEYSEVAAIHAVIDKMFPAGAPVPAGGCRRGRYRSSSRTPCSPPGGAWAACAVRSGGRPD